MFNGEYITGDVDSAYLEGLEQSRNDSAKTARSQASANARLNQVVGIHNNRS